MKTVITSMRYKLPLLVLTLLAAVYSFAQEVTQQASHSSTSQSATSNNVPDTDMWYNAPWVWIVGAGVLLLILLLLIRGGGRNDHVVKRTTTTTTVHSDY